MKLFQNIIPKTIAVAILGFAITGCTDDPIDLGPKPVADFAASGTSLTEHDSVTFTDLSTNEPYLWTWNFAGGTPTYSSANSPIVVYDVPGVYAVTVTVRNDAGADEITKVDYIEVTGAQIPFLSIYKFSENLTDEGSNLIDAVSNYGDPVYTEDHNGNANSAWLAPNLTLEYLSIPDFKAIGGDAPRTVTAWFISPSTSASRRTIVSWGENSGGAMFNVMMQDGQVRVEAGASNVRTTRAGLNDDTWHHLAVTYDPADGPYLQDVKIYIDGELEANNADGSGSYNSETTVINTDILTNDVRIGAENYTDNYFWDGALDDIRILDVVLIPEQIQAIMAETK